MCIYSTPKLELFSLKMGCHLLWALLTKYTVTSPATFGKDAWTANGCLNT